MTSRTPSTAAGRRLVADATDHPIWASAMPGYVLAIEAEAKAEARAPLDVERLARALTGVWTYSEPFSAMQDADKLAREYAALEEPTP